MTDDLQITPKRRSNAYKDDDNNSAAVQNSAGVGSSSYDDVDFDLHRNRSAKHLETNSFTKVIQMAQTSPVYNNFALNSSSTRFEMFSMQQNIKSTPIKTTNIVNPFEQHDLIETMQMSSCSPSVFSRVISPSKLENDSSDFRWEVDHVAMLYPKEFEVNHQHHHQPPIDEETEEKVQTAINSYFAKMYVPSPWISNNIKSVSRRESINVNETSCDEGYAASNKKNVWSQTALSIPVDVDLNGILGQYFNFNENQDEQNDSISKDSLSVSNLRRKLFVNDDEDDEVETGKSVQEKYSLLGHYSITSPQKIEDYLHYRATSVSPPKHIQSPVESPIKPFVDANLEMKSTEESVASMNCSFMGSSDCLEPKLSSISVRIEGEKRNDDFAEAAEWDSNMESVNSAPMIQDKDTGYQTGPGNGVGADNMPNVSPFNTNLSLFANSTDAQIPPQSINFFSSNQAPSNQIKSSSDSSWSPSVFSTPSKHHNCTS
ncbi:hypothetical protein CHUAL_006283 [Chamberlinius hualienensis]